MIIGISICDCSKQRGHQHVGTIQINVDAPFKNIGDIDLLAVAVPDDALPAKAVDYLGKLMTYDDMVAAGWKPQRVQHG